MAKRIRHGESIEGEINISVRNLYIRGEQTLALAEKYVKDTEEGEGLPATILEPLRSAVLNLGSALQVMVTVYKTKRSNPAIKECEEIAKELDEKILATPTGSERDELTASAIGVQLCINRIRSMK